MDDVYYTFEQFYINKRDRFAKFHTHSEEEYEKICAMFNTGICYPLIDRDETGQKIMIFRVSKWDLSKYSFYDVTKFVGIVLAFSLLKEAGVNGVNLIFDATGITLQHLISPMEILSYASFGKSMPLKLKNIYVIDSSSFMNTVGNFIVRTFSEKLKSRVLILKSFDDLKKHLNSDSLPQEFGGLHTEHEMIEKLVKFELAYRSFFLEVVNFNVDVNKIPLEKMDPRYAYDAVGSFRKLEVD